MKRAPRPLFTLRPRGDSNNCLLITITSRSSASFIEVATFYVAKAGVGPDRPSVPECVALPNRLQSPPKPYFRERGGTDVVRQNAFRTSLPQWRKCLNPVVTSAMP